MLSKYQQEEKHSNKSQSKETKHSEILGKEKTPMKLHNSKSPSRKKENSLKEFNNFRDKTLNKTSEIIGHEKSNSTKVNPLQEKRAKESNLKQETKTTIQPETFPEDIHSTKSKGFLERKVSKKFNNNNIALKVGKHLSRQNRTLNITDLRGLNKTKRIAFYKIAYNACIIARKRNDSIKLQQRAEHQQELSPTEPCPFCSPFLSKYYKSKNNTML